MKYFVIVAAWTKLNKWFRWKLSKNLWCSPEFKYYLILCEQNWFEAENLTTDDLADVEK